MAIPIEQREALAKLAEVIFPLQDWITDKSRVFVPGVAVPWRKPGARLKVSDLKVIDFLEELLEFEDKVTADDLHEEKADHDLAERWRKLPKASQSLQKDLGRETWRQNRSTGDAVAKKAKGEMLETKLDKLVFGAPGSANFVLADGNSPITRGEMYAAWLPILQELIATEQLGDPNDENEKPKWKTFVDSLFRDLVDLSHVNLGHLRQEASGKTPKASEFVKQFSKDVLHAMMNFRSSASEPFQEAVSLEAGEYRRPGNVYDRSDTIAAVAAFQRLLHDAVQIPQ